MTEQQNEENHLKNYQCFRNFFTHKEATFSQQGKNLKTLRETYQPGSHRKKTRIPRQILTMVSFIIFCLLIKNANCDCVDSYVQEKFYVSDRSYCQMVYDSCANYQFTQCSQVICSSNGQNCATVSGITSYNTCSSFCCQNYNDPKNDQNTLSYNFCDPANSSSTIIPLGTILVAVCATVFVGAIIFLCICRKFRNRNQQNNQNIDQIIPSHPVSTAVDLNQFKIQTQGPYFIDSKQTCVICLDTKVTLRTHCGHYYHGSCLLAWLKKKPDNPCPLCMGLHYNPIKVFCTSCHYGDKLVNIEHNTPEETVKKYDTYKCHNCNNLNQKSFSLNDENSSPVRSQDLSQKSKKESKIQFNQTHVPQLSSKIKRRRRLHRQKSSQNSSTQVQDANIQSLKNLKHNNGQDINFP